MQIWGVRRQLDILLNTKVKEKKAPRMLCGTVGYYVSFPQKDAEIELERWYSGLEQWLLFQRF